MSIGGMGGNLNEKKNYCKTNLMSVCTAKDSEERKECEFHEKSRIRDKCMFYIFDEYCDCLKAQIDSRGE